MKNLDVLVAGLILVVWCPHPRNLTQNMVCRCWFDPGNNVMIPFPKSCSYNDGKALLGCLVKKKLKQSEILHYEHSNKCLAYLGYTFL